jgi:hypothetical protein
MRLALKLATGAGKTTVMAMLIAWQTINAVRRSGSSRFTRGFGRWAFAEFTDAIVCSGLRRTLRSEAIPTSKLQTS